jgi:Rod binding domain-containing protein
MLVDAIARDLARAGGLGLAAPVFRELLRAQESNTPTQETT